MYVIPAFSEAEPRGSQFIPNLGYKKGLEMQLSAKALDTIPRTAIKQEQKHYPQERKQL